MTALRAVLRRAPGALHAGAALALPLVVLAGASRFGARATSVALGVLFLPSLVRAAAAPRARGAVLVLPLSAVLLLAVAAILDDARFMLAYPVLVNGVLLLRFGLSLLAGPPLVERFARLRAPDLSPEERRYCRTVTIVWCAFFVLNGTAAGLLAALAPRSWWAAYTGAIAYALVGLVFAVEYVVRKARFRRYGRGPVDRLLAAVLGTPAAG